MYAVTFPIASEAGALKVGPGGFVIQNVIPGRRYDCYGEAGLRLTITNDDDIAHTYMLTAKRPAGKWEKGYLAMPDARWCWFEPNEITLDAHAKGYGRVYIEVPDEDRYYNQNWIVNLNVSGKPGPMGIALAVTIRAQVETKSNADAQGRPDGVIAFKPSTVRFNSSTLENKVAIYNNDTKKHTYKITPLFKEKGTEPIRYLTTSYEEAPGVNRLVPNKGSVKIKPGGRAELGIKLNMPNKPAYAGKKWEELFLVAPEEGEAGFIRARIETPQTEKE